MTILVLQLISCHMRELSKCCNMYCHYIFYKNDVLHSQSQLLRYFSKQPTGKIILRTLNSHVGFRGLVLRTCLNPQFKHNIGLSLSFSFLYVSVPQQKLLVSASSLKQHSHQMYYSNRKFEQ